jgi:hypothetical protein
MKAPDKRSRLLTPDKLGFSKQDKAYSTLGKTLSNNNFVDRKFNNLLSYEQDAQNGVNSAFIQSTTKTPFLAPGAEFVPDDGSQYNNPGADPCGTFYMLVENGGFPDCYIMTEDGCRLEWI